MIDANLTGTNLSGTNLTGTYLLRANLTSAILEGANLKGATIWETIFSDVDLNKTEGLEDCQHLGPSTIDHRTLMKSGPLPLPFLRGCGLPDLMIDYLPSLRAEPFQFYSCFISYSSKDQEFAERLHADLQNKDVRCWFAPEDLKIGARTRTAIDEVIRVYDKLLLILSKNSIRSDWVEKEVDTGFEKERERKETVLFPIRLDDSVMNLKTGWAADIKRTRHIGDFRNWRDPDSYKRALDRLLRDLKAEAAKGTRKA